jgi:hypothetical protein
LTQLGRHFGLSNELGSGVWCGEDGVFVGGVPLLEQADGRSGFDQWQPRPVSDINRNLSECYGLPIEFTAKIGGLAAVSRALNRGDLLHAQIATLHLQIPDPPPLTKSPQNAHEIVDLARQLQASGLLKEGWDPSKHPRWPAGSPDSIGGRFAPAGASGDSVGRGAKCAGRSSANFNSSAARTSGHNSLPLRNPASSGHPGRQPPQQSEKSLSRPRGLRRGVGPCARILSRVVRQKKNG